MLMDRKQLLAAANLVAAEAAKLDTSEQICPCCGLNKRASWAEWQAARELQALERKLRSLAGSNVTA